MWEIFSFGTFPFFECHSGNEVLDKILSDQMPVKPLSCTETVYNIMKKCWERDPAKRIVWKDLVKELEAVITPLRATAIYHS